jgi:hypothetical protein
MGARRTVLLALAGAVVVAGVAAVVVVATRDDPEPPDGRFAAEPNACRSVRDSGAEAALPEKMIDVRRHFDEDLRAGDDNSACYLVVRRYGTSAGEYTDLPYITVQFFVEKWKTQDETAIAERTVTELAKGFRPVSGVGDQAFVKDADVWLRVSNLIVNVRDAPAEAESAAVEFARLLGRHLQTL